MSESLTKKIIQKEFWHELEKGHSVKVVKTDDVLKILEDYNIKPQDELVESTAEAFSKIHDEINRQLKFHGIFRSETSIIIDPKQNKFVAVEREKLQELKKFWNTHPKYPHENIADEVVGYSQTMSYINEVAEFFESYVKKFVELFGDTKKENPRK